MMAKRTYSISGGFLTATALVLASTSLGAAAAVPTCGGQEATIFMSIDNAGTGDTEIVVGTDGPDVMLVESTGLAHVDSLDGDDIVCVHGPFLIETGDGDDVVFVQGPPANESKLVVLAGAGDDIVHGGDSQIGDGNGNGFVLEFLLGEAGDDVIHGNLGRDIIFGMDGADTLYGNAGIDLIYGGGGADAIYGGWGDDAIYGGDPPVDDDVYGQEAQSQFPDSGDELYGGPGNDFVSGNLGADVLHGGPGDDMLVSNLAQDLSTLDGATPLFPLARDNAGARMFGGTGDDLVVGSNRWDRIQGGPGNDTLWGFEGRDYIRGGPGNDQIIGGGAMDDLNGNTGNDHIVYDGDEPINGGWGIDRCEIKTWPTDLDTTSCERNGLPTLTYSPPLAYERGAERENTVSGTSISEGELRTGDCIYHRVLHSDRSAPPSAVFKVDCANEHFHEVYREALIDSSIIAYDRAAINAYAVEVCDQFLTAYIGANDDRHLKFTFLIPSEDTWNDGSNPDRVVTCLLFDGDSNMLTGRAA